MKESGGGCLRNCIVIIAPSESILIKLRALITISRTDSPTSVPTSLRPLSINDWCINLVVCDDNMTVNTGGTTVIVTITINTTTFVRKCISVSILIKKHRVWVVFGQRGLDEAGMHIGHGDPVASQTAAQT